MARYAVEHIWEGKKEYFLIRDHQSWQMVLLPSKYLTHLIRANRSPNTVGRRAKSIRFYLEYLNETELELSQVAEQEFQEQYEHYVGFLHWLKAGNHLNDKKEKLPSNKTCNAYLKDVFRFFCFLELEADMERLKVLYYDSFTTHDSIGVKRKLRFRSFNGYLKEEERNVRPAEHNEILELLKQCTNCRDQLLIMLLAETGYRIGEILGVDYTRDIDYERHTIRVFFRDDNENRARAKNAAYRNAKISDATFQFLLFYLSKYRELLQHQQMLFVNIEGETKGKALQVDLERNETVHVPITCLRGFDRIFIHRMKEELKTLAGQRKYTTEYRDQWMCLTHYPEIEIAESFLASKDGKELLWDFTLGCPRNLKMQIFTVLKVVIHTYEGEMRKEKLLALRRFYQFCVKHQVADIETMTLDKEQQFEQELAEEFKGRKKRTVFGILRTSRKILFIQASEIHWQANVWFLERFHFSKERMNPSKPIELVSFKEVTNLENQKILQKYLRYLFGITDLCISTIRIKLLELRTFLVHFNGEKKPIYEMEAEKIQKYLEGIRNQNTREATANGRIFMILQFYNFLVVKRYLKKIPFRHEYYLQKEVRVHNDRSVPEGVYTEILSKLAEFPEHLRLMFLHLWCTGIRGSEVCTLTGDGYEEKDGDYWLKVYQVKMKTYKRIPIPEALYKLVQVYKKKYQIGPEEYLFQNQTGGAFRYGTFRYQMLKYCEKYQIADGEYLFKSHDYRHNLATLYYDSGISLQAVRDYLGHEYEEMTRQYVDYMPKKLEKASEAYFQEETHSFAAELMKGEFHG